MGTALSAETLETVEHSKRLIPDSPSLTVSPDAKNFRIEIYIYIYIYIYRTTGLTLAFQTLFPFIVSNVGYIYRFCGQRIEFYALRQV
jgi:hypothetical protein